MACLGGLWCWLAPQTWGMQIWHLRSLCPWLAAVTSEMVPPHYVCQTEPQGQVSFGLVPERWSHGSQLLAGSLTRSSCVCTELPVHVAVARLQRLRLAAISGSRPPQAFRSIQWPLESVSIFARVNSALSLRSNP